MTGTGVLDGNWSIGQELKYRTETGVQDRNWSIGQELEYGVQDIEYVVQSVPVYAGIDWQLELINYTYTDKSTHLYFEQTS